MHFGKIWTIFISKNQSDTLPALLKNFLDNFLWKWLYVPQKKYAVSVICCLKYYAWWSKANFLNKIISKFENFLFLS
jgi:hypothetical protein